MLSALQEELNTTVLNCFTQIYFDDLNIPCFTAKYNQLHFVINVINPDHGFYASEAVHTVVPGDPKCTENCLHELYHQLVED